MLLCRNSSMGHRSPLPMPLLLLLLCVAAAVVLLSLSPAHVMYTSTCAVFVVALSYAVLRRYSYFTLYTVAFSSPTGELCISQPLESACANAFRLFCHTHTYQVHDRHHCGCFQTRATATTTAAAPAVLLFLSSSCCCTAELMRAAFYHIHRMYISRFLVC